MITGAGETEQLLARAERGETAARSNSWPHTGNDSGG